MRKTGAFIKKNYPNKLKILVMYCLWLFGFVLVWLIPNYVMAQEPSFTLQLNSTPQTKKIISSIRFNTVFKDSSSIFQELPKLIQSLQKQSYWEARIDSTRWKKDTLLAHLSIGRSYTWKTLHKGNVSPILLDAIGFKSKYYENKPVKWQEIEKLKTQILAYSENHGYPFATIQLDSMRLDSSQLEAQLAYEPNLLIHFDTIQVIGNLKIKNSYLSRYLRLVSGQIFNQNKINQAEQLLRQLPFVEVVKSSTVLFGSERAFVQFYLNKRKANQLDGFIGILPNATAQIGQNSQTLLTGEANIQLRNLFYTGKNLKIKWQRLQVQSQSLDLEYENPNAFRSYVDWKVNFFLIRQDSGFVSNQLRFTLAYSLPSTGKLSFFINQLKSNLGTAINLISSETLPTISEVAYLSYGIGYDWNNLNDIFIPRKGLKIHFSANLGNKRIFKNLFLSDSLYDGIPLRTTQLNLMGSLAQYFWMGKRSTLLSRIQGATIFNQQLFLNELFRIGGLNSLRGHNENIFFASSFLIATLEYRILLEKESFFFVFFDQAYWRKKVFNQPTEDDFPFGAGLGLNVSVRAGVFQLVYALGQSKEQAFNFNRSKIHFGLISRF